MKRIEIAKSRKLLIVYRVELVAVIFLVLLIISGGLFAIIRSPDSKPLFRLGGRENTLAFADTAGNRGEPSIFNGIGRLRIPAAGQNGAATIILSIAFPYPAGDQAFTEELASKIIVFRSLAVEYFSSLSAAALANLDEESAKAELLKRYNAALRLGKIETLYFSDLMIID